MLAFSLAALPHMAAAQDPNNGELDIDTIDEDELLELESFKDEEPIPDINAEAEDRDR